MRKFLKNTFSIIFGCILMAAGTSFFLLPNKLSAGGFAGISTIVYYLFKIPLGTFMLAINVPVFILTYYKLGKRFAINSIIGATLYSVFVDIFDKLPAVTDDRLLACIYGGILTGVGTGILLNVKSSTGGTELVTNIIRSYNAKYTTSKLIIIIDTVIVILNVIFFGEIEIGLYSAIAIIIMGKVIDILVEGTNFSKLLFIISEKNDKIAKEIGTNVKRGSTGIYGKGMFKDNSKIVLMCAIGRGDLPKVKQIVKEIDKDAFIIISNAREVLGMGFRKE